VGGVIGFALVYGGAKSVIWAGRTSSFPYYTGVVVIVASWFISPLMAGIMSYLLFLLLRVAVLRGPTAPSKAIWCLPILLLITVFVNLFFILYKVGLPQSVGLFTSRVRCEHKHRDCCCRGA
jgi:sodium-dependent phosphate transporter